MSFTHKRINEGITSKHYRKLSKHVHIIIIKKETSEQGKLPGVKGTFHNY